MRNYNLKHDIGIPFFKRFSLAAIGLVGLTIPASADNAVAVPSIAGIPILNMVAIFLFGLAAVMGIYCLYSFRSSEVADEQENHEDTS